MQIYSCYSILSPYCIKPSNYSAFILHCHWSEVQKHRLPEQMNKTFSRAEIHQVHVELFTQTPAHLLSQVDLFGQVWVMLFRFGWHQITAGGMTGLCWSWSHSRWTTPSKFSTEYISPPAPKPLFLNPYCTKNDTVLFAGSWEYVWLHHHYELEDIFPCHFVLAGVVVLLETRKITKAEHLSPVDMYILTETFNNLWQATCVELFHLAQMALISFRLIGSGSRCPWRGSHIP